MPRRSPLGWPGVGLVPERVGARGTRERFLPNKRRYARKRRGDTMLPAVPLPASREQIRKLGERLAAGDPVSDDDLGTLEELVACHMAVLELARPRLDGVAETVGIEPVHITHRPKTTTTIIEKLRRQRDMNLARMQDLAGIRVVGTFSLAEQDQLAAEVAAASLPTRVRRGS